LRIYSALFFAIISLYKFLYFLKIYQQYLIHDAIPTPVQNYVLRKNIQCSSTVHSTVCRIRKYKFTQKYY